MTPQEETNVNWLAMAVTLPTSYIGEVCYYDKRDNVFFILTQLDYILNDNRLRPCFINSYTDEEVTFLTDKLTRLEADTNELIDIPRISIDDRVKLQMNFVSNLVVTKYYSELVSVIENQDHTTTFVLDKHLQQNADLSQLIDHWWDFKYQHLIEPINHFEARYGLNLSTVAIFHIDPKRRSMTKIKSPEPINQPGSAILKAKAWWKFW